MNRHLLYIAFWFPPSRASGVYRALATVKVFNEAGWDVTVLTCSIGYLEDEVGSTDDTLMAEIPEDVAVIRVPFSTGLTQGVDVRSLSRFSANFPGIWKALRGRDRHHDLSERYSTWVDPAVAAGLKVSSTRKLDHVLATGNPYSALEAARIIALETGTRFSVDYRDPWTIDVFTGEVTGNRSIRGAEQRIIDGADFVFHVNDAIADAYRHLYPESAEKQRVVHNGYDQVSIPDPPAASTPPYRFGILGTVNDRWPMKPIFKGWAASRPDLPPGSELVLAGHLGYFDHSRDAIEAALPDEESGFRYIGPVKKAAVSDFYASIDVLVLPVPGGPMVTSGKVFEALALGKPVVCVQAAGGGARALLDGHPLSVGAEPDAESVRTAFLRAASMAHELDPDVVAAVRASGTRYERHRAMQPMIEAISGLRGEPR